MIADLDKVLRALLLRELPYQNGEVEIMFEQPNQEWSSRLSKPTVNLFLYDLRENPQLRQHQWQTSENRQGPSTRVTQKRTPLRYDCYYMLTTWVHDHPESEHRLLTLCMLALARFPVLPEDLLQDTQLANPVYDINTRLANHDVLTNPAEVWGALNNDLRPSVSYVVTLTLDPWTAIPVHAVQTVTLRTGQASEPSRRTQLMAQNLLAEVHFIGGVVRQPGVDGRLEPVANITVAIKGTGLFAVSDEQGRYRLDNVSTGQQTLVAWPATGKPREKVITVPAGKNETYDIEL